MEAAVSSRLELRPGSEVEIFTVLSGSRAIWGAGVSMEDYIEYHRLIRHHGWSAQNFQHLVLVDDLNTILSSCKQYKHRVRLDGQTLRVASVGAVFTPPEYRSRGYANQMLEHIMDELRGQGFDLIMLYSDIGTEFYARLNFRTVIKYDPAYTFINNKFPPSEISVYEYLPEQLLDWHLSYSQKQRFSLARTPLYFQLLSERISWHRKYMGFRDQRVIVSDQEQSYLWVDLNKWRPIIRDFASASENPPEALARLLAALQARFGFKEIGGWLPAEFDGYHFLKISEKHLRAKTIPMVSPLSEQGSLVLQLPDDEIHFWLADYF